MAFGGGGHLIQTKTLSNSKSIKPLLSNFCTSVCRRIDYFKQRSLSGHIFKFNNNLNEKITLDGGPQKIILWHGWRRPIKIQYYNIRIVVVYLIETIHSAIHCIHYHSYTMTMRIRICVIIWTTSHYISKIYHNSIHWTRHYFWKSNIQIAQTFGQSDFATI